MGSRSQRSHSVAAVAIEEAIQSIHPPRLAFCHGSRSHSPAVPSEGSRRGSATSPSPCILPNGIRIFRPSPSTSQASPGTLGTVVSYVHYSLVISFFFPATQTHSKQPFLASLAWNVKRRQFGHHGFTKWLDFQPISSLFFVFFSSADLRNAQHSQHRGCFVDRRLPLVAFSRSCAALADVMNTISVSRSWPCAGVPRRTRHGRMAISSSSASISAWRALMIFWH